MIRYTAEQFAHLSDGVPVTRMVSDCGTQTLPLIGAHTKATDRHGKTVLVHEVNPRVG